jgi:hypothetical protein
MQGALAFTLLLLDFGMALGGELSQPLGFPPDEIFIFRFAGFYGHISPSQALRIPQGDRCAP